MRPAQVPIGSAAATALASQDLLLVAPTLNVTANPTRVDASPSVVALAEIPPELQSRYTAATEKCAGLPSQIIAAVAAIESGDSTFHGSSVEPTTVDVRPPIVRPPIVGPALDGRPGFAAINDPTPSDRWAHSRAMMQSLAATWPAYATLGQGQPDNATPDIDNAGDATPTATAARFLGNDNDTVTDLQTAITRYNKSDAYVDTVLAKATEYGLGNTNRPETDRNLLVPINSDGTRPTVKAAT